MNKYKTPSLTADIFIYNDKEEFILIKRKNEPFKNYWALPGGFVDYGETVENAAIREAKEETSIDVELQQLINVYSNPNRDSRRHTVTVAYTAIGNFNDAKAADDAADIKIFRFDEIENIDLAFDHKKIIKDALKLMRIQ
ncbi:MAG: NUDIX hydrolase [Methanobrevibacter sp.]|uniref:NUDIX hydrolase n=1 Tax=Methanobrevibacter sp. TaxID=66852 RepID=UPI0026DF4942|nr:NUDIX hydrolase [Methanobrevibacter sp.]MDO5848623.1 NUDIX hydrolase [Methanobrevibacter sp.]